jgi:6-pyruvoyltetrahydropterin/6-carboxytetrahydropterin synthase
VSRLDHYLLNEIEGLENPTSELVAVWIWRQLAPHIPQLHRITIEETCSSRCHYYGSDSSDVGGPSTKGSASS